MKRRHLQAYLYLKFYKNLNQCILYAIDYDDRCDLGLDDTSSKASKSSAKVSLKVEHIIKGFMEKMQQFYGLTKATKRNMDRPHIYGVCGGNHPTF